MAKKKTSGELSNETKTIITVILLVLVYPAGIILMWIWKLWPLWVRILLTCLLIIPLIFVFLVLGFIAGVLGFVFSNPDVQKELKETISVEMSQEENENDDRKVYKNTIFPITFTYPSDWEEKTYNNSPKTQFIVLQDPNADDPLLISKGIQTKTNRGVTGFKTIEQLQEALPNPNQEQEQYIGEDKGDQLSKNEKVFMLNGYPAFSREVYFSQDSDAGNYEVYILDGKGNVISAQSPILEKNTMNQLLKSLQFTQ